MEKKLYCVRVVMYVMAENASEASVAATKAPFDIFECKARKADRVDAGWENAIPYNADDERTCAEILASEPAFRSANSFLVSSARRESTLHAALTSVVQRFPG